ncbi:unnamed protein product [Acanthoscelides obtectus]|uniref:Uncharacterized protein n=1 Tax=Acanthoscelides obtectus TaxID=200917 RepID=A0A9P0KU14_ACAOB|nr:unnamed protein product [Acanthoscelides obtectus]CAK1670207.1 hypothetical protein AOBTE_LOCUS27474 [Acanthoscelides obtectus]
METLLASLRREKMKMKKSIETGKGTEEVYTSTWFTFTSLQFILDKNKTKPSLNTMHLCEDEVCHQEGTGSTVEHKASAKVDDPASQEKESSNIAESPQIKRIIQSSGKNRKKAKSTMSSGTESGTERLDQAFQILQSSAKQIKMNVTALEIL